MAAAKTTLTAGKLQIAAAGKIDLEEIMAIEQLSFAKPWSRRQFNPELSTTSALFLVCQATAGHLAGFILVHGNLDEAELLKIAVRPEARRQGIATVLIEYTLRQLWLQGITKLFLEVRETNIGAQSFYLANGFQIISRRRKYYSNPREDALIMAAELGQPSREFC